MININYPIFLLYIILYVFIIKLASTNLNKKLVEMLSIMGYFTLVIMWILFL